MSINQYLPRSGRILKEDGSTVNEADLLLEQNPDAGTVLTTQALGAGATYTQAAQDRIVRTFPVGRVSGLIWADQGGTLYLEESQDGTTWTETTSVAVSASVLATLSWTSLTKRFFRFRYVNGAVGQGSFVLTQQVEGLGGKINLRYNAL